MKTLARVCSSDTATRNQALSPVVAALLSLSLISTVPSARAATYYWDTTTTGTWQTGANWSTTATTGGTTGVVPTSSDTGVFNQSSVNGAEIVQFSADASIAGLTFANTGTTLLDSDSATTRLLTMGTSGITINSGAGAVTLGNATNTLNLAVNGAQTWANNSGNTFTVVNGVTNSSSSTPVTLTIGGSGNTTVSGIVADNGSGTLALTKSGAGTLTLSGANTYTGGTTVSVGTLKIGNATALGGNASVVSVTGGAALDLNGITMTGTNALTLNGTGISSGGALTNSSSTTGTYAGLMTLGSASSIIAGSGNILLTNTGTITGSGFGLTVGGAKDTTIAGIIGTGAGTLTKQDAGTLNLSGASTLSGATTINGGTLAFSGVGGSLASSAVTLNSTSNFTVSGSNGTGAAVTRTNGITLNGGRLSVSSIQGTQNTTDSFGVLTLGQGAGVLNSTFLSGGSNVISVTPNGKNARVNFDSVTVNSGGTVLFVTNNSGGGFRIGANTLASATAAGINIAFNTAPTIIGDAVSGGTITTTSGIIPWAITNTAAPVAGTISDFVTYDSAYGVRTLTSYSADLALSGGKAQNVKLTAADSTNNTNATINSLIINNTGGNLTQNIVGTLTVNSGAVLLNPGFSSSALSTTIAGGTLQLGMGGADGYIYMQQARLNTISSVIAGPDASHNLVLNFGNSNNTAGVLVLSGNNTYAGGTIVNSANSASGLVIGGTASGAALSAPTLTAGTTGSFGSGDVTLNNIKVYLNRSNAFTLANNIGGSGSSVIQQSATGTATLSGNISGTVGVSQSTAASTLVLSGTNTNTGATTLSAGTLQLNGAASMSSGSTLALSGGTTLNLRSNTTASFTTAGITASGNGTYNLDVDNLTSGTGQTLTLAGSGAFGNGSQQINVTSGSTGYVLGLGAISHNTTANGASFTINATTAGVTLSSFTFGSFGSNLTLQGGNDITIGGMKFGSNGSETITIAGANATFTGSNTGINNRSTGGYGVVLSSGTLNMNYAGFMTNPASSSTPTLTIAGGTLDNTSGGSITQSTNAPVALNGDFTFGGTNALNLGTGAVTLSASHTITTNGSAILTLGGAISGSGYGLVKAGVGNLKLSGNNTYTGLTDVQAGTLTLGRSGGTIADTASVQVSGGTLDVANSDTVGAVTLSSGTISGAGTLTGSSYSLTNSGTISSVLGGTGIALTKTGAGTATLSAANTYTGGTTVSDGTLTLASGGSAGTVRGTLTINSGATVNLTAADALGYTVGTNVDTVNIVGGTLNNAVNGNNSYKTNFVLTGGTMAETVTTTGTSGYNFDSGYGITTNASASSSLISGRLVNRAGTLDFNVADGAATDDLIVSGVILSNGGTGISKSGAGKMVLTGANTYTGTTTVTDGTLNLGAANTVSSSSNVVLNGGTLQSAFSQTLGTLNLSASSTLDLSSGGEFSFTGSSSLAGSWSGTLTISGTFVNYSSVRFGTNSGGLTSGQLGQITVNGLAANIDSNGYLFTAIPEPTAYAALVGAGALFLVAMCRRRKSSLACSE